MNELIKALTIFAKYGDVSHPFHCEHDVLTICGYDPAIVSDEDKVELDRLGFFVDETEECFRSFRYGSA